MNPEKGKPSQVIPTFIPVVCLGSFATIGLGGEEQAVTEVRVLESQSTGERRVWSGRKLGNRVPEMGRLQRVTGSEKLYRTSILEPAWAVPIGL